MRALPALLLAALAGCSFSPSTAAYKPKSSGDCPGQKACGYRCVDQDDPAAGCGTDGCDACPSGAAHTVPVCLAIGECGLACEAGHVAPDGDPAHGCTAASATDAANCGSTGHACGAGEACSGGLCQVATLQASAGTAPRGLAVLSADAYAWVDSPPTGPPAGVLHWVKGGAAQPDVTGLGRASWVRWESDAHTDALVVAATDPDDPTLIQAYVHDAAAGAEMRWIFGTAEAELVGLVALGGWAVQAVKPDGPESWASNQLSFDSIVPGYSGGGSVFFDDVTIDGLGSGAGSLWPGAYYGVGRYRYEGPPDGDPWGFEQVLSAGVPFTDLLAAPHPNRIAVRAGSGGAGQDEVIFADLSDGSIWAGIAATGTAPRRLVRGDGARSQMDLAADEGGVVWSDLDRGEIWGYQPASGNPPFLLARGKPWAIALTAGRVYWTDVEARAIRSVAR